MPIAREELIERTDRLRGKMREAGLQPKIDWDRR